MSEKNKDAVVPVFKVHSIPNDAKTKEKGRPIYDDIEVCEIRMAGNRNTVGVFPAHDVWKWEERDGFNREPVTYAMRFQKQYEAFKASGAQALEGTPLEELPFLAQGKRLELKALNVHTAEALASLDGQMLKNLGMGGRELKNQAKAYLDAASSSADVTKLAGENEALREQIEAMRRDMEMLNAAKTTPAESKSPFADEDDEMLKELIAEATGSRPRGNPSHETLVRMADEVLAKKEAEDKEAA